MRRSSASIPPEYRAAAKGTTVGSSALGPLVDRACTVSARVSPRREFRGDSARAVPVLYDPGRRRRGLDRRRHSGGRGKLPRDVVVISKSVSILALAGPDVTAVRSFDWTGWFPPGTQTISGFSISGNVSAAGTDGGVRAHWMLGNRYRRRHRNCEQRWDQRGPDELPVRRQRDDRPLSGRVLHRGHGLRVHDGRLSRGPLPPSSR